MLNLENQTNVVAQEYYFFPAFLNAFDNRDLWAKPLSQWTIEERADLLKVLQSGANKLDGDVMAAEVEGKVLFVKEHTSFMVEPATWMEFQEASLAKLNNDETHETPRKHTPWTVDVGSLSSATASLFHHPNNTTPLPDAYLATWHPTFLIRHPALAFPSYLKQVGSGGFLKMNPQMTLRYTRRLYEFYCAHFGKSTTQPTSASDLVTTSAQWPLILSADDVISQPAVLARWCDLSGLDASKVLYKWKSTTEEEKKKMHPVQAKMTESLQGSTGVLKDKMSDGVVIEQERMKWQEQFGEEAAVWLERWVRDAMDDYEYLLERRLRV